MDLGMDEEDAIKESRDSLRWGFSFIAIWKTMVNFFRAGV